MPPSIQINAMYIKFASEVVTTNPIVLMVACSIAGLQMVLSARSNNHANGMDIKTARMVEGKAIAQSI